MSSPLTTHRLRFRLKPLIATAVFGLACCTAFAQVPKYNSNSAATATVYLDFDGQVVKGTAWNWDSTIHARPAGLSSSAIAEIFNRVAEDYRIFNINITTDSTVYAKAPVGKRVRIIVTPTSNWYGVAGGISFVNSFTWGDGTPAWVFSDILQKNSKYIGEACSHEAGHTLGLQHQSTFSKSCALVTEYAEGRGDGEIGWAPIMGLSYYKNVTTWNIGTSIEGCSVIQNDINIISKGLNNVGFRPDDHGNTKETSTPVNFSGAAFSSNGMINSGPDVDVFKLTLAKTSLLKTKVTPNNVGIGNAGANIDIKLNLLKSTGDTIGRYNPKTLLDASIDTTLKAGIYYLTVEGIANQNTVDYNSIGHYIIAGTADPVLYVKNLVLKGNIENNIHLMNWNYEADEPVTGTSVECSFNGVDFKTIASIAPAITTFKYKPFGNGSMYYRVKMLIDQDYSPYYSNVISLQYSASGKISLLSNMINNAALINVSNNYAYELMDETGRMYQRGQLRAGLNNVSINTSKKGLLLLKVYSSTEQALFKLIKQ